jgi:hypothetical protein
MASLLPRPGAVDPVMAVHAFGIKTKTALIFLPTLYRTITCSLVALTWESPPGIIESPLAFRGVGQRLPLE